MNKENWDKFLSEIIKSSINNFDKIGDNLRAQCVKYFEQLETNRDEAIEYIKENKDDVFWNEFRLDELLEILKGDPDES